MTRDIDTMMQDAARERALEEAAQIVERFEASNHERADTIGEAIEAAVCRRIALVLSNVAADIRERAGEEDNKRMRLQRAALDDASWCRFCGCGNDKWGYAHLDACTRPKG